MTTINLSKPGELEANLSFPTQWNELLPAEILHTAKTLISGLLPAEIRATILLYFIDSRAKAEKVKLPKKWKSDIDPERFFMEGNSLLDFIFTENLLTTPPEASINLAGTRTYKVYAPAKGFNSLTCGEFEAAELAYAKFLADEKPQHLAMIAAIIWREKNVPYQTKKGDRIETFAADRWVPLFMKLESHRLYAIFIWYTGCKNMLPKKFPTMHEPDPDKEPTNDPLAFTKCVHAGAGAKNGTRDSIRLMMLNEFMFDMEQEAIKAKELKAQYDAAKQ